MLEYALMMIAKTFTRKRGATLILFACLALILAACSPAHEWHGSPYQDPGPAPDINLTTTEGEPFRLDDHRDDVVMLFFGYTSCPDVCPGTNANAARILERLGKRADSVEYVFVTIDPERDDPQAIREFLDKFHPDFIGVHGEPEELDRVKSAYGVFAEPDDPAADDHEHDHEEEGAHTRDHGEDGYTVTHTSRIFLIDPNGRLVTNYTVGTPNEDIIADITYLLEQR